MGEIIAMTTGLGTRLGWRRAISAVDWYERGRSLEATDAAAAMTAYRRAIAGRRDLSDAYNNLGRLHHDRGELGDAEALYRLAICARGDVAVYWFNLGVALEDVGRRAEAIASYERAIELDNTLADAHFNLAGQLERAARSDADGELVLELRRAVRHLARYRELAER